MAGESPPGEDRPEGGWLPPEPAGDEPDLSGPGATQPDAGPGEQTTSQGFAAPAGAQPAPPATGYAQPPQGYAPPPGYAQPGQPHPGYAPPPTGQAQHGYPPPPGQPPAGYPPPPGQPLHQQYPPAQPPPGWGQQPTYQQQPAYQQEPGWHAPGGYAQPLTPVPTNGAAVAGFVLSVCSAGLLVTSFGFLWPATLIGAIIGLIYSRKGKRAVAERRTDKHGQLAQAGFVIGIVVIVLSVFAIAGCAALVADPDFRHDLNNDNNSGGFESVIRLTRLLAGTLGL